LIAAGARKNHKLNTLVVHGNETLPRLKLALTPRADVAAQRKYRAARWERPGRAPQRRKHEQHSGDENLFHPLLADPIATCRLISITNHDWEKSSMLIALAVVDCQLSGSSVHPKSFCGNLMPSGRALALSSSQ
jgi:hypothetical protein